VDAPPKRALEVVDLVKSFSVDNRGKSGGKLVLQDLSLHVDEGEFVSLLGPSGSGKTTLLQLIGGLERADSGTIYVGGQALRPGERGKIAYMPQYAALLPWLTITRNVTLALEISGVERAEAARLTAQWLPSVGLGAEGAAYPHELSGGMLQRASFLRALLAPQPLMCLDEPFAALDALNRQHMQEWLLSIWERERRSVLFITHSIEEALLLSDRLIIISKSPAHVVREIRVPFARPRSLDLWTDPLFNELKTEIYSLLSM
jgi:ABC-type nitrate/sulfonate/bicarbonate transport system ATPase subunit